MRHRPTPAQVAFATFILPVLLTALLCAAGVARPALADPSAPTSLQPRVYLPYMGAVPTNAPRYYYNLAAPPRRLTACENKGKHNIFLKVLDENDQPLDGVTLVQVPQGEIGSVLDRKVSGSKGSGLLEFDMWAHAYYAVYVVESSTGTLPANSHIAEPLHTNFTDEEQCQDGGGGNTLYHNSFEVIFRRGNLPLPLPTTTPEVTPEPTNTVTPSPTEEPTTTPPPTGYLFNEASVTRCDPQAAGTWFDGMVTLNGQPANGYNVVYSWLPDGPPCTEPVITGPHYGYTWNDGYYSHLVGVGSPRAGDWYVWIIKSATDSTRISTIAHWQSTGPGPGDSGCNEATINFNGP